MESGHVQFVVAGCNHRSTPLEVRERLALGPEGLQGLRQSLRDDSDLQEAYLLHTCNRLEIYAIAKQPDSADVLLRHMKTATGFDSAELARHAYVRHGQEAIKHLFSVASGLDSQLLGETEILGQVKTAYSEAASADLVGTYLHRILQKTLQAAKWTRTHTAIGQGQVSIGNVTVELAERIFGRLEKARTLVVGSGEVGREVGRALHSRGVTAIAVSSRRIESASALAKEVAGETIPFASWPEKLRYVDIAIFATSAPGPLLEHNLVRSLMKNRVEEPLFIVDLAVPRDVEASVAELDGVFLYNFGDLAAIANHNRALREAEVERCQRILEQRAAQLWQRLGG